MRDMMNQIVEKEAKKEEEMKELGINVQDEKSNSSGSDSNPSADEMDVRKHFLTDCCCVERLNAVDQWKYNKFG